MLRLDRVAEAQDKGQPITVDGAPITVDTAAMAAYRASIAERDAGAQ
jgi:hypothetical protein